MVDVATSLYSSFSQNTIIRKIITISIIRGKSPFTSVALIPVEREQKVAEGMRFLQPPYLGFAPPPLGYFISLTLLIKIMPRLQNLRLF